MIDQLIPENHQYYHLLKPLLNLSNIFQTQQTDHKSTLQTKYQLEIYCRENKNATFHTFIYSFTFPVTPEQYLKSIQNYQLQKQLDLNTDQFKIYKQSKDPNTEILYYSSKQILIIKPRYLIYVRYTLYLNNEIWIISASDPNCELLKNKTKAELVRTIIRLQPVNNHCHVSILSQVDFKMNLSFQNMKNRGFLQISKYLNRLLQWFNKK